MPNQATAKRIMSRAPREVVAKTASYTVKGSDVGKCFTTRGATGAIVFTLPAVTSVKQGWICDFYNIEDQNMTVASVTGGDLITINTITANSVAFSTASEKIGGGFTIVKCTSAKFFAIARLGLVTQTVTVA